VENHQLFGEVCERLMKATGTSTEAALADELGFKPAAFSNRKKRGALPREEIDALIAAHRINPAWAYSGDGPMFEGGDLDDKRLNDYQELVAQMQAMSISMAAKNVVEPIIKGLVWGDAQGVESALDSLSEMSAKERALVQAYRQSPPDIKAAIEVVSGLNASARQSRSVKQVIHGKVGQMITGDATIAKQTFHAAESPAASKPPSPNKSHK
jgi:hypothetical protein